MSLEGIISVIKQNEMEIRSFGVRKLGIFGSFVKGNSSRNSSIAIFFCRFGK